MKYLERLFKAPAAAMPEGVILCETDDDVYRDLVKSPSATYQLRTNLERVMRAYNDREQVLVDEIAAREAELADVRRARDATTAALVELEVTDLPDLTVTEEAIHG